jgi:phospholipid/cholesterol/gamma-HCH transport system permease protein
MKFIQNFGRKAISFTRQFGSFVILAGQILRYFPRVFKDRKLVMEQMAIVGADSLPLVLLIGSFTGAIAALQATNLFDKFNMIGVATPFLGSSIATVVFTELTPVLTALVIAGRVGGAIAAQIGTMSVSEQLDALEMMAIDKIRFLAMPRVIAALVMMPLLVIFSDVVAILGGFALTHFKFGFSSNTFFGSLVTFFSSYDVFVGIIKSFVFGGTTAIIGVHTGFNTSGGAEGVGRSTVRSFTISASTILVLDAIFGYIL